MTNFNCDDEELFQNLQPYHLFERCKESDVRMLISMIGQIEIPVLDLMTIRDLMELGRCQGDVPLFMGLMCLFTALEEGSLCLNLDEMLMLNRFPKELRENAVSFIEDFKVRISNGDYQALIATDGDTFLPLILDESSGKKRLYFQKYHQHEKRLQIRMDLFLNSESSLSISEQTVDRLLAEIYSDSFAVRVGLDNRPIEPDPEQLKAIRLVLTSQFSIISGGPGTGKTSLLVNMLRSIVRAGIPVSDIVLGAPTGRAAQRITETIRQYIATIQNPSAEDSKLVDLKGSTLHKILRFKGGDHEFVFQDANPLPASVAVIDEVSMVDVVMLDSFLHAIDPKKTKLIFLGDKDQLPSVEAGSMLAEMIPDDTGSKKFKNRFVVLKNVYRSGVNLRNLAGGINRGEFPSAKAVAFEDALTNAPDRWAFVEAERIEKWRENLDQWMAHQYLSRPAGDGKSYKELIAEAGELADDQMIGSEHGRNLLYRIFQRIRQARILAVLRNGIFGCIGINALIADRLINIFDHMSNFQTGVFSGALIIITRNDYVKELFNGDVGIVLKDAAHSYKAYFDRSEYYVSFPVNLLPPWELAFAMTVHKSQGSEFDDVLLVLPDDEKHRLLTREIVYTGVTRAKKRVILYGKRAALDTALTRKIERQSGLTWK